MREEGVLVGIGVGGYILSVCKDQRAGRRQEWGSR